MRLTDEQAVSLGLVPKGKKKTSKRKRITDYIKDIATAKVRMVKRNNMYAIYIGSAIPSLNTVLGWDKKREYPSYNKAWRKRIYDAALEFNLHNENCTSPFKLFIHIQRKRVVDMDNIFVKQIIDATCHSGLLHDDDPRYIAGYEAFEAKASKPYHHPSSAIQRAYSARK